MFIMQRKLYIDHYDYAYNVQACKETTLYIRSRAIKLVKLYTASAGYMCIVQLL